VNNTKGIKPTIVFKYHHTIKRRGKLMFVTPVFVIPLLQ